MTGAVSLVGAGCGGRDLLTLGALRCIRGAHQKFKGCIF